MYIENTMINIIYIKKFTTFFQINNKIKPNIINIGFNPITFALDRIEKKKTKSTKPICKPNK